MGDVAYGPLVAILAAYKLDTAFAYTDSIAPTAVPVAIIYNFDRQYGYDTLHIAPGFSCLYLWKDSEWHARMRQIGAEKPVSPACYLPVQLSDREFATWPQLEVMPARLPAGLGPEDVPPVARWDWDPLNQLQYIGIRCGDEWCNIGPRHFDPKPATIDPETRAMVMAAFEPIPEPPPPAVGIEQATQREKDRVLNLDGWYDQQRLDLRTWLGKLRLTAIVGTAIPHPALNKVTEEMYHETWIPVAYVVTSADYVGRVPLEAGLTRVYQCQGTMSACGIKKLAHSCATSMGESDEGWWEKRVSRSEIPVFSCVKRNTHQGKPIPVAASRWSWRESDAQTWSKCGGACCTVN